MQHLNSEHAMAIERVGVLKHLRLCVVIGGGLASVSILQHITFHYYKTVGSNVKPHLPTLYSLVCYSNLHLYSVHNITLLILVLFNFKYW